MFIKHPASDQMGYLIGVLQPAQLTRFFANFIMPLLEGVDIETDLVCAP